MAQKSIHKNAAAFYKETTPCVGPADPSEYTFIEHLKSDVSGIKQIILTDPTLETRIMSVNRRQKIHGIRNCEYATEIKLHGTGVTTADGDQVEETYLATLLEHCMGGMIRSFSTTITGGTAAIPILDDVTGVIPGMVLSFEDITSPVGKNVGKSHPRQVLSVNTMTKAVTLAEVLPFTPAATDKVHGTITLHIDEDFLEDAVAAQGTMAWFIQKTKPGSGGTDHLWKVEGSVASFQLQNLSRGQLPSIALNIMGANFRHGSGDGLANITPSEIVGNAQLSCGIDIQCSIAPYGNTATGYVDVNQCNFDVGYTRERVETTTENIDRFEGTCSYTIKPGSPKFSITIPQYDIAWYNALKAHSEFRITFYQPGDGSGPGKMWALLIPRSQLVNTPGRADVNENHAVTLEFEPMEPDNVTHDANVELEKSIYLLALA